MKPALVMVNAYSKHIIILSLMFYCVWTLGIIKQDYSNVKMLKKSTKRSFPIDMHFKHDIGDLYKKASDLLIRKNILIASDQKFSLLRKNNDKSYLLVDYKLILRDNFIDFMDFVNSLSKQKLIYNIDSININRKNDSNTNLEIDIQYKALAYDKLN